jgi:hypothetical protein
MVKQLFECFNKNFGLVIDKKIVRVIEYWITQIVLR